MIALHCDQENCDSWVRTGSYAAREFLTVTGHESGVGSGQFKRLFCTLNCLMLWAASHSEPTEQLVEL